MVVYADELIIKNFIMSYLILTIVGDILNFKYKKTNLIIGSFVATIITLIAVIYGKEDSFLIKAIIISLMSIIAFKPKQIRMFIVSITFLIGGIVNSNIKNVFEIVICGIICIIAFKEYTKYYKQKKWKTRNEYKLEFEIENNKIDVKAFLDTGNFLTTNIKDEPVIVISKDALQEKVSKKIMNLLLNGEIENLSFSVLKNIRPVNYLVLNEGMKMTYGLKVKNVR